MMRRRKGYDRQTLWMLIALMVGCLIVAIIECGHQNPVEAYLGGYAPTDTLHFQLAVNDTSGNAANPTTFQAYFYMNGTMYDSVGFASSKVRYWYPTKGLVNGRVTASSAGTTYGIGSVFYKVTVQGLVVGRTDNWSVDSLWTWDGSVRNIGSLTTSEKTILADSVATGKPTRWAALNDSIWTYHYRTLTDWDALVDSIWANADTLYAIVTDTVTCTVADTVYSYATMDSTTTSILERILGLSQENYYMDDMDFTGSLLTQARVRVYEDSSYVGTINGVIATYRITTTYDGNNVETYKVVRE